MLIVDQIHLYLFNLFTKTIFFTFVFWLNEWKNLCYLDRAKIGVDTVPFKIDPTMAPQGNTRSQIWIFCLQTHEFLLFSLGS